MKYNLQTTNLKLTDTDQKLLDKKLNRLTKLLPAPYITDIRLTHDAHHLKGAVMTCIINIEHGKHVFHTERTAESLQDAIDQALEAMQQELRKNRDKEIRAKRTTRRMSPRS